MISRVRGRFSMGRPSPRSLVEAPLSLPLFYGAPSCQPTKYTSSSSLSDPLLTSALKLVLATLQPPGLVLLTRPSPLRRPSLPSDSYRGPPTFRGFRHLHGSLSCRCLQYCAHTHTRPGQEAEPALQSTCTCSKQKATTRAPAGSAFGSNTNHVVLFDLETSPSSLTSSANATCDEQCDSQNALHMLLLKAKELMVFEGTSAALAESLIRKHRDQD